MLLKQLVTVCFVTLALGACNKDKSPPPAGNDPPPTSGADAEPAGDKAASPASGRAEGNKLFKQKCAVCHGENGMGDGPGSAALDPKPRAFGDPAWQAKVTDEDLKKVILYGGMAVGMSAVMPASPELRKKPEVIDALIAKIRGFKQTQPGDAP